MDWFLQLKAALPAYYRADRPSDVVGYLRGSVDPTVWRQMAATQNRHQMLILGNTEPTQDEWVAAGVAGRGTSHAVRRGILDGFIVLYGGFMLRPWGQIHAADTDAETIGFPASLVSWKRNAPAPRR